MVNAPSTHDFEVVDSRTLYEGAILALRKDRVCLLYTSPSPRD